MAYQRAAGHIPSSSEGPNALGTPTGKQGSKRNALLAQEARKRAGGSMGASKPGRVLPAGRNATRASQQAPSAAAMTTPDQNFPPIGAAARKLYGQGAAYGRKPGTGAIGAGVADPTRNQP